ncbi:hypothetical protein [Paracoccus sp. SSJ]|uniref:hypothetical protein n=1 Tax=Paracoccus sp. SSJ TaxID=3050636 RepID=UPI00254CBB97|nr:hypothetical protein [Paracoccus sp. SSJ]MDK8874356.1 hypothetical protein [Paracoccus sp. SSJ]
MSELDKLIGAVERGEPNRNDGTLFRLFGDDWVHAWDVIDRGSLDAAMALHEALLPGVNYTIQNAGACYVHSHAGEFPGWAPTPARAWLIAILKAYRTAQREA